MTAAWLTARLTEAGALTTGAVTGLRWEAIGTGQVGDSVRFHIDYDCPGAGPATIAGKFAAEDPASRQTGQMLSLYRNEVGFYRGLRPLLAVRTPAPLFAAIAEDGGDFILLFEDLAPARGGNQLAGCSADDARAAMRQAAALHAPSTGHAGLTALDWLHPRPEITAHVNASYPAAQALFRDRYADQLAPELMAVADRLAEETGKWNREPKLKCLIHGDYRLDNMLFDIHGGDEPLAILDWQTVRLGDGMTDIGYFLGCGIGSELRRAHEDELLDLYCEEMSRRGAATTRADIWDDYRRGALHGVSTAVFSAAFVERTDRGDAMFLHMARGACELALEHDSLGALMKE